MRRASNLRGPNQTVPLTLVPNSNGRSTGTKARLRIDTGGFPSSKGAYVVRFKNRPIARLNGASPILRVGTACSWGGFRERFRQYNHQQDVTISKKSLFDLLEERCQKTNVYLMYFLSRWADKEPIEVDLYF